MITIPIKSATVLYDQLIEILLRNDVDYKTIAILKDLFTIIFGRNYKALMNSPLQYVIDAYYVESELYGLRLCGLCKHCDSKQCIGHNGVGSNNTPINGCWCYSPHGELGWHFDPNNELKMATMAIPATKRYITQLF